MIEATDRQTKRQTGKQTQIQTQMTEDKDTNTNTNSNSNANTDTNTDTNTDIHADTDTNTDYKDKESTCCLLTLLSKTLGRNETVYETSKEKGGGEESNCTMPPVMPLNRRPFVEHSVQYCSCTP